MAVAVIFASRNWFHATPGLKRHTVYTLNAVRGGDSSWVGGGRIHCLPENWNHDNGSDWSMYCIWLRASR